MKRNLPTLSRTALLAAAWLAGTQITSADLAAWQTQVTSAGQAPAGTLFSPTLGTSPSQVDVGALSGDRSFEFIVNAGVGGASSALLGTRGANGNQGLKFEQWQDSEEYGVTAFGVVDLYATGSKVAKNADTHVAFISGASGTDLFVNGVLSYSFAGTSLNLSGLQGLGGIYDNNAPGTYFDKLDGTILGFASYDTALEASELLQHYQAFAVVPEPSTLAMAALGGCALAVSLRRRSR